MSIVATKLFDSQYAPSSVGSLYTSPVGTNTIIDKFSANNGTAGPVTLTVYLVPTGGTAGASNAIMTAVSIAAGADLDCTILQNQILNAGDFIAVVASAGTSIVVRSSGRQVTP